MDAVISPFKGIQLGTVGASVLVLLLVALAHAALKLWTRRRHQREQARSLASSIPGGRDSRWLTATMADLVAPVALLLWINGLHYALAQLLDDVQLPALAGRLPAFIDTLRAVGTILALMWLLARIGRGIEAWLRAVALRTEGKTDDRFLPVIGIAIRLLLPLLAIFMGSPLLALPEHLQSVFRYGVSLALIGTFAYVLYRLVDAACQVVLSRHRLDVPDNREARSIYTQVTVLRKVALSVIAILALASMLLVFEPVRRFGTTILASAGVAGIVIGFAAQRSIAMLLAGFQIALTQPIRIDDVVIVEDEWGRIEEITLTYVVVRIWDLRRLILPINYFLEKPFQNWTRSSANLLATVFLFVDYRVPLDEVRAELTRILESSKLWDRKVNVLQVTDSTERTMQIRALASAADASLAWDLRCEVREKLIHFLQQKHPESLPRLRMSQHEEG